MKLLTATRNTLCSVLTIAQIIAFPSFAIAQEAAPETSSVSEPTSTPAEPAPGEPTSPRGATTTGPTAPTGSDSTTYTQNPDGTWSNGQYTWDPATQQTKPNTPQEYSYNPATGQWDTTEYVYSPESGKYVPNVKSSATNPNATAVQGLASPGAGGAGSGGTAIINGTGPNSNNTIGGTANNNGLFNLFFNGAISNTVNSNAASGNALVQGNTLGGDALTGNAAAIANVLNMLQSSWLGQSPDVASFISNIDGNVYGDLIIDPNALPYSLGSANNNIDVNVSTNAAIDNDINLSAKTGDATVSGNTLGGDATTGNAQAMVNVINMINSAIHAGKSFLGMININGNYDGDILLPSGILDALIASTGPNSNNTIGGDSNSNLNVTNDATKTINNNISTTAASGNATIDSNTEAGGAATGQANTSTNTMNVIGQDIKGKNGLLVFVNVLGKWVGLVVGPANATINNTGPNSNNTIGGGGSTNVSVNSNENSLINNNINVAAASGNATVSNNTKAGNARSGNADISVNLLNVIGSDIDVTDWFGVLFINVFGSWAGNFGSDTEHGGFSQSPSPASSGDGAGSSSTMAASGGASGGNNARRQVFGFASRLTGTGANQEATTAADDQSSTTNQDVQGETVFGSTTPPKNNNGASSSNTNSAASFNAWALAGAIGMVGATILLVREYLLALREERIA